MLVEWIGQEGVFLAIGVCFQRVDFIVHPDDQLFDGLVGGGVQFLGNILGVYLAHDLCDQVLRLLDLFLFFVFHFAIPLLFFTALFMNIFEFFIEFSNFIQANDGNALFLCLFGIDLGHLGVSHLLVLWEDI